ncbi:MAG: NapC/NirT family cytochrome c [Thermohalobaculum sp.]|nr:NapC/NirT family cytochrome c [Thermohalobaculum sp.]
MTDNNDEPAGRGRRWRRIVLFGVPITTAAALFAAGIVFWGGFNTAMEATNTLTFCISCHEMRENVYAEYRHTIHYKNRTGVSASCSDCHVPDPWVHKMVRKVQASRELWHKAMGTIDTREKFEENRLRLASRVWAAMKSTDSRECRNCHTLDSMAPQFQAPRARQQHLNAMQTGQTCIDCHKGIAHNSVRHLVPDEQLEELEKPVAAHIREVPQSFLDSLAFIEAEEAKAAEEAAAAARAAEEAIAARVASAVEAARADERAQLAGQGAPAGGSAVAAAAGAGGGAGGVAAGLDWSAVPARSVTLFYPGQASFEWVQIGKEHGGARPFLKGGEQCSTCHAKELDAIGTKIVRGEKLEPTPIPGKRPTVDVTVQAAHDGETLHLRLQWQQGAHTPVPFVDGGKMDPENPMKVAMMIAGTGIERVEQAGCWATCHNDNRYMPDAPDAGALAAAGALAERLRVVDGVPKYLGESRTEISGKKAPLGGWDKLRTEDEIAAFLAAGTFMDLVRVNAAGAVDNGHLLETRVPGDGAALLAEARRDGDTWTVVLSRPLVPGAPGDVAIEPGRLYTVGFAVHDDYTAARFHHVSLDLTLGLDDPAAQINVVGQ